MLASCHWLQARGALLHGLYFRLDLLCFSSLKIDWFQLQNFFLDSSGVLLQLLCRLCFGGNICKLLRAKIHNWRWQGSLGDNIESIDIDVRAILAKIVIAWLLLQNLIVEVGVVPKVPLSGYILELFQFLPSLLNGKVGCSI